MKDWTQRWEYLDAIERAGNLDCDASLNKITESQKAEITTLYYNERTKFDGPLDPVGSDEERRRDLAVFDSGFGVSFNGGYGPASIDTGAGGL
jgi:hypothetical protein